MSTKKKREKKSLWLPSVLLALPVAILLVLGFLFAGPVLMKLLHAMIKMGVMA